MNNRERESNGRKLKDQLYKGKLFFLYFSRNYNITQMLAKGQRISSSTSTNTEYEIWDVVGRGAQGVVYFAQNLINNRG